MNLDRRPDRWAHAQARAPTAELRQLHCGGAVELEPLTQYHRFVTTFLVRPCNGSPLRMGPLVELERFLAHAQAHLALYDASR